MSSSADRLRRIERACAIPLAVLGFIWLFLVIAGLVLGPRPWLAAITTAVWLIFVADFAIRLILSEHRGTFLKRNALLAASLIVPALGMFRIVPILSTIPAWEGSILRIAASINRSMGILGATMHRRGIVYAIALIAIVTFAGAAGMYAFERHVPGTSITSYPDALWWTAMVMTTLGSDYFPHSVGGRMLCLLLSIFAFSVFGYVTAAISSYFINQDADDTTSDVPSAQQLAELLTEVRALRTAIEENGR